MYGVNDIFDYESDIKNPRKNGSINGSVLPLKLHNKLWAVMLLSNVPFIVYFVLIGTFKSSVFLAAMLFLVFAYSIKLLRFKEIPVVDSLTSAFHYSSPFLFATLLYDSPGSYLPIFTAFFLWVAGNHAFGAIQDIVPDREGGISSIATKLGSKYTLYFTISAYASAACVLVFAYGTIGLLGAAALLPYLVIVLRCLPERSNEKSALFSTGWRYFLYCNYIVGAIGSMLLLYLYNK